MNRTISFITKMMFAAVTVIMAACSSDDNATQALTVQVKVSMPKDSSPTFYIQGTLLQWVNTLPLQTKKV